MGNLNYYILQMKIVQSLSLVKLVFRFVKIFLPENTAKIFRPECPLNEIISAGQNVQKSKLQN